jgi:hypothetical protein
MSEYPVGYEMMQTYEVPHCMSGENCLRRPTHLAVYTTQITDISRENRIGVRM